MPKANADAFPAHGNAAGPTAGVKCDLCYDILNSNPIAFSLHRTTEQDRTIGKDVLSHAKKGDLVMRDMGYFDLSEFAYLESIGSYWLTRLPLSVNLVNEQGKSLEDLLEMTVENCLDTIVYVGDTRHNCRLIALRASSAIAEKRRRERRAKAKELGKTPSREALIRDGWHLMLSNVSATTLGATSLGELYRTRWAIEIQFRAWKQSTHIASALNRRSNTNHLEALVCASMIIALLGLRQMEIFADQRGRGMLSPEKLMDWIAEVIARACDISQLANARPHAPHIQRDKRLRKSTVYQGLAALS